MAWLRENPKLLKLGEHGTFRQFSPMIYRDVGTDDDPMSGDFGRPPNMSIRHQTETKTNFFSTSSANNVRCQFLAAMTEYQHMSQEELRYEDYLLNRSACAGPKGGMVNKPEFRIPGPGLPLFPLPTSYGRMQNPWYILQQDAAKVAFSGAGTFQSSSAPAPTIFTGNMFGTNASPFANPALGTGTFGNPVPNTTTVFTNPNWTTGITTPTQSQSGNTSIFGNPSWASTPPAPSTSWNNQNSQPTNAFGASPFGAQFQSAPPTANAFGTVPQITSSFCTSQTGSPFGVPQNNNIFGAQQQTGSPFGVPQPQPNNIFGIAQTGSPFGAPQNNNLFAAPQTGSPFGMTQPQNNIYGAQQQTGSPFGVTQPQTNNIFGIPQTGSFFGTQTPQSGSLFGTLTSNPFGAPANTQQPSPFAPTQQAFSFAAPNTNQPFQFPNAQSGQTHGQIFQFQNPATSGFLFPSPASTNTPFGFQFNPNLNTSTNSAQFQFQPPTPTTFQLASHTFPELPFLPNGILEERMAKSKSETAPDFEIVREAAKVRAYERRVNAQELQFQNWIQSFLYGNGQGGPEQATSSLIDEPKKPNARAKFIHWSDPALYLPKSRKSDSDESFKLKTGSWKSLNLSQRQKDDLYEKLGNLRRTLDAVQKLKWGKPSKAIRSPKKSPSKESVIDNLFDCVDKQKHKPDLLTTAKTPEIKMHYWNRAFGDSSHVSEEVLPKDSRTIVLKREKYYCKPTINELNRWRNSQGACLVDNFEIGHTEWGKVIFLGTMDLSGINLDTSILFRHKEVVIHPSDEAVPAFGLGFNRAAIVTLEKVWPVNPRTNKLMLALSRTDIATYERFLRNACLTAGSTFMNYEPEIGRWTFKVEHFSRPDHPEPAKAS